MKRLALFFLLCACGSETKSPPPVPAPAWRVSDSALRDAQNRTVVLRGANIAGEHKKTPYFGTHTKEDFFRLRSEWGFNSIRLLTSWAAIEPQRDVFDDAYVSALAERAAWAKEANLAVVLDMHQDLYGEGFAPGGGDGAPKWTCDESRYAAFTPTMPWFFGSFDPNVAACWDGLYTTDLSVHFTKAWRRVAERLAKNDAIVGFDILNEPFWGTYSVLGFEQDRLRPLYESVIRSVREVAPTWVAFVEPAASRNGGLATRLDAISATNLAYAPHSYDRDAESGKPFDATRRNALISNIAALGQEARSLGAMLYIGEYGGPANDPGLGDYVSATYDGAGAVGGSTAYWEFGKEDSGYGALTADGKIKPAVLDAIGVPYPERVAGTLVSYAFDRNDKKFTVVFDADPAIKAPTEIYAPHRIYTSGPRVDCACTSEITGDIVRLSVQKAGRITATISR